MEKLDRLACAKHYGDCSNLKYLKYFVPNFKNKIRLKIQKVVFIYSSFGKKCLIFLDIFQAKFGHHILK